MEQKITLGSQYTFEVGSKVIHAPRFSLVASLKLGSVKAPDLMQVLARQSSLSGLRRTIAEIGRVAETLYLLNYIDQPHYGLRIGTQLNRHERRNTLVRTVTHGHKGQLYKKYLAGLEK